jgi:hypothetical protein
MGLYQASRQVLVTLVTLIALAICASAAQAASCTDTWYGPGGGPGSGQTGDWGTATNWSSDVVPGTGDNVCITAPGTYTVTLTSEDTNGGPTVNSLTLGAGSGAQTQELDVLGQDFYNGSHEATPFTALTLTSASTVTSTGELVIEATDTGVSNGGGPVGGSAQLIASSLTNAGLMVSEFDGGPNTYNPQLQGVLTNTATGTIDVASGTLDPTGNNEFELTNDGTMTVASGATLSALAGQFGSDRSDLTNNGSVTNNGTLVLNGSTWTQSGGSVSGNAVVMQSGTSLVDSVGAGSFLFDDQDASISGSIPAAQTVTVQGEAYSCCGGGNGTSLALNAGGNTAPVTNNGTIILDAPGSGSSSGGPAYLTNGTLDNNGTVISQDEDSTWHNDIQANINNSTTGKFDLAGGTMYEEGSTLTNSGTVTVASTGLWILDGGGAFVNTAAGTLDVDIASAATHGDFQLNNPCCNPAGAFTAGGTLNPTLVGGYVPTANELFSLWSQGGGSFANTFANVTGGFVADYNTTSETYGVIYDPAATTTAAKPNPSVGAVSAGKKGLTVKLTCPAGTDSCSTAQITGTVTEHLKHGKVTGTSASVSNKTAKKTTRVITVASATCTLKAGTSKMLTVTLNRAGRALLAKFHKLTVRTKVSYGGKTVKTVTLVFHAPTKKRK